MFFNEFYGDTAVWQGQVVDQSRMLGHIDFVGTMSDQIRRQTCDAVADHECNQFGVEAVGKLTSPTKELQTYLREGCSIGFRIYPHTVFHEISIQMMCSFLNSFTRLLIPASDRSKHWGSRGVSFTFSTLLIHVADP